MATWEKVVTGTAAIDQGGTGQTAKADAFDALSPTTTQGDIVIHNGSDNIRLATGTNGQILQANGSGANPGWVTFSSASLADVTALAIALG
jgi:hypothetical protein|tara:strand:- start:28 stop:300 length:273 start_codon:yes stop_codon:yes gene_type:complete